MLSGGGLSVARISGLRRWVSVAAALSLAVTAAAMSVALAAVVGARDSSRELSQRLVPAAAAAGVLLQQYTEQQTSLRDYVTSGNSASLAPYRQAAAEIPGQQNTVAGLVAGHPVMAGQVGAAAAAQRLWLARVAGPQLAAAARGDFARARALQANIPFTRPFTLAVRARIADLQARITRVQGQVVARIIGAQGRLLAALLAMCATLALVAIGGVVLVRRWLLTPFLALRRAAESVAAGDYGTRVPTVGPAELADLGRAIELMRTRLVAALAGARQAEERFRALLESSPDATLTVAADGSILMVNVQAERLFGYDASELVGQQVEILVPAAARGLHRGKRADYAANPVPRPMGEGLTLLAVCKDRRELPVEISLSSLPTESGLVVLAAIRDISERLAAEAERDRLRAEAERARLEQREQQSRRLESLGQLVGGVAHDFNNLLNVISGYADFVAERVTTLLGDGDEQFEPLLADVEQIRGAAARAARLTRQLLIFARRDVIHPEVLNLNEVIGDVEQLLRRTLGEHIDLVINLASGLYPVKADAGQLEQVLVNLAVNARDAMPGGGSLTIDLSNADVDAAYAGARPHLEPGRYARLRVSDTGTGMDRDTVARAFEPFYTTKPAGHGTGLGLATVYGIVTQAGGYVHIYSEPGLGTTVSALLPVTEDAVTVTESATATLEPGHGERILVVEDEQSLRDMTCRILARNGYHICAATTASDALRLASDLAKPVDLLLTDVVMPEMLGNEVAARVCAIRPATHVLYMSGYAQTVLGAEGALDPDIDLLEKPFSEAALLARVRQAIDRPGPGGTRAPTGD